MKEITVFCHQSYVTGEYHGQHARLLIEPSYARFHSRTHYSVTTGYVSIVSHIFLLVYLHIFALSFSGVPFVLRSTFLVVYYSQWPQTPTLHK